jgi:hypothetical protein
MFKRLNSSLLIVSEDYSIVIHTRLQLSLPRRTLSHARELLARGFDCYLAYLRDFVLYAKSVMKMTGLSSSKPNIAKCQKGS